MSQRSIMWFRQDLRLADNPALTAAAAAGALIAVYILDDETPGRWRWGGASRWWLHHSLESLAADLRRKGVRLILRRGRADQVMAALLAETNADAVYFTRDYAPWSPALETRIKATAGEAGAACRRYGGALLHEPEAIRTGAGQPYKVFTPFAQACRAAGEPRPPLPVPAQIQGWDGKIDGDDLSDWALRPEKPNWAQGFSRQWTPGETGGRQRLYEFIDDALADYPENRDRPDRGTSHLSPHLHWGEISPFQCWHAVTAAMAHKRGRLDRAGEKFLGEILWREFCHQLLFHAPQLPDEPYRKEFGSFPWKSDAQALRAWQRGRTGYPIVDAGMREVWQTGVMHNRVRMVTASFLVKDLLVDWREGEGWFWDTLVDADLANNAANWQWVAGSGADAAPYFRIFNPVLQGEKFDPVGDYVRRWVPELAGLPDEVIHKPWTASSPSILRNAGVTLGETYPRPIVDHGEARDRALAALTRMKA